MPAPRTHRNTKVVRGDHYLATHQASVDAILGANMRRVISKGVAFYNRDFWPLAWFVVELCGWASKNPGQKPTFQIISDLVAKANAKRVSDPHIGIAGTPLRLTLSVALALVGGAYHEAWHTKYSRRQPLNAREMYALVMSVWDRIPDWSKLAPTINRWSNLIEDIRIERCGCRQYPGAKFKMHDLQDFILNQEEESRRKAIAQIETTIRMGLWAAAQMARGLDPRRVVRTLTPDDLKAQLEAVESPPGAPSIQAQVDAAVEQQLNTALPVISGVFRDVGLGYNTARQRRALDAYQERNADAVRFVLDGPLSDLLRQAIRLSEDDDMGCLRLSLEVMVHIYEEAQKDPQNGDQGEGSGDSKPQCPNCGSPNLKVRPLSDGKGGKVPGKGVLVCEDCGHKEEQDLEESQGQGQGSDSGIEYEDTPEDPEDSDDQGDSGQDGDDSEEGEDQDQNGSGKGSEGDDDQDQDGKGAGSSQDGDDSEEDEDQDGNGAGSDNSEDADDQDGNGSDDSEDADDSDEGDTNQGSKPEQDGDADDADDADDGQDSDEGENQDGSGTTKPHQGGGHNWEEGSANPRDLAQEFLDDAADQKDDGLKDGSSALGEAFEDTKDKEDESCFPGEAAYRPYDRSQDSMTVVEPSHKGKGDDSRRAQALLDSVRQEAAYLRARLRVLVRSVQQSGIEHGVRRGRGLSERMFVDDVASIRGGRMPNRAYYEVEDEIDTSMAAVVVMDQSISMDHLLPVATQIFMAITEPLDALGCATAAIGFRDGQGGWKNTNRVVPQGDDRRYHRGHAVHIDVFKSFEERFGTIKWRFANTRATGGTPMADGVQVGLEMLASRPETHRVLFVVTDGYPNGGHAEVIQRQIRLAREAGILVVGVLLGSGASYGKGVFPDYTYCEDAASMPKKLIAKLNQLMDFRGLRRRPGAGRSLRQTG